MIALARSSPPNSKRLAQQFRHSQGVGLIDSCGRRDVLGFAVEADLGAHGKEFATALEQQLGHGQQLAHESL
jgi:hypothetical protein